MRASLRELHQARQPIVMPAAHDALSARLIEQAGFSALATSGSGILAARYALPDIGVANFGDVLSANRDIIDATSLPCLADGDDGYGDVKSVARTVQLIERAGAAAIVMEDQQRLHKQPGQNTAIALSTPQEFSAKIAVATHTRDSADFWIVARTDAYGVNGIDDALRRAETYLNAGADALFVAGIRTEEDLVRVGQAFVGTPLLTVMYGLSGWPSLSPQELGSLGFTQIVYPLALLLPVCMVMTEVLVGLREDENSGRSAGGFASEAEARGILQSAIKAKDWELVGSPRE